MRQRWSAGGWRWLALAGGGCQGAGGALGGDLRESLRQLRRKGPMSDAKDVILKHIAAMNAHDEDADPWAADAEMVAPGAGASGRDNVLAFLGVFHEAFPDLRLEVKQLLGDGSAAAAEGSLVGTHDGVLHTPNGDVAPTGRAVELRWSAVYSTDGDALKSEHLFFDQMDFLGQLGLLPG